MKYRNITLTFGILSIILLITLILKLEHVSQGMNISGVFLGIIIIFGIVVGCVVLTKILRLVNRNIPFWPTLLITTTLSFIAFHLQLYVAE